MGSLRALRVYEEDGKVSARLVDLDSAELSDGEVLIRAEWSGLNYKDALTVTGTVRIMQSVPLNAGIDVAGTVEHSQDSRYRAGDKVLVTGCGLGEQKDGGYAELVRVPGDWVIPLPDGFDSRRAMAIGTAGFTAGMAMLRMEHNGQSAFRGPLLVNGASGGVGSFAVRLFSRAGYSVTAVTGKRDAYEYLRALGAETVLDAAELDFSSDAGPLGRAQWGGAVDNLGGDALAWLIRTVRPWGNVAAVGLAAGMQLESTVMPFLLRGVSLLGVNSVHCARELRVAVWDRIGELLNPDDCDTIVSEEIDLSAVLDRAADMLARKIRGRVLVRLAAGR